MCSKLDFYVFIDLQFFFQYIEIDYRFVIRSLIQHLGFIKNINYKKCLMFKLDMG
jgi:hypothetical protein